MGKSLRAGIIVTVLLLTQCIALCSGCIEAQRQALLKLKQSVKDPENMLFSWNATTDCCSWSGVGCDLKTGHVDVLELNDSYRLTSSKLSATEVSPSLAQLKHLRHLSMQFDFQGIQIPDLFSSFEHLEDLDLRYAGFGGTIPESLGNLSNLLSLDLRDNILTGAVPESLGRLAKDFDSLRLSNNRLRGPIPESLGRLSSLSLLDLSNNLFNGTIPESLGRLSSLRELYLSNNLLSGSIPQSLGRLSNLMDLRLSSNKLTGSIPVSIGRLGKLNILDISSNSLDGTLSELNFSNLSSLTAILASGNNLSCGFKPDWIPGFNLTFVDMSFWDMRSRPPRWLQTQTRLQFLDLSNANISGSFPTWLRGLSELYHLDLSSNQISGNIPTNLADSFPSLQTLRLRNNLLSGPLPESFCKLFLHLLDLSRNNLSGELPDCWPSFGLVIVLLSFNRFSGRIPISISRMEHLRQLHLNNNRLEGEIPLALKNSTKLELLDLGENRLSGTIPSLFGESLSSLRVLKLRNNMFNGSIPRQLCENTELQILDVALNSLSGEIPFCFNNITRMANQYKWPPRDDFDEFGPGDYDTNEWENEEINEVTKGLELEYTTTLKFLYSIDLSSNQLVGSIPEELCELFRLRSLNLSHNHLSGNIPSKIEGFTTIESLDLSDNRLSGKIPRGLSTLKYLNHLDLSDNELSGKIPTSSQLQTLNDPSIYAGNLLLCGAPLSRKCPGEEDDSTNPPKDSGHGDEDREEDKYEKIWFYYAVVLGYATGLWAVIGTLVLKRHWRIAYFRFVDDTKEHMLAKMEVCVARLKMKLEKIATKIRG